MHCWKVTILQSHSLKMSHFKPVFLFNFQQHLMFIRFTKKKNCTFFLKKKHELSHVIPKYTTLYDFFYVFYCFYKVYRERDIQYLIGHFYSFFFQTGISYLLTLISACSNIFIT